MIADIGFEGLWDCTMKTRFESTLRECIDDAPENESCNIVVTSFGSYCVLLAKTPQRSFRKAFALCGLEFVDALPVWLKQFPLQHCTNTPDGHADQRRRICPSDKSVDPEQPNTPETCASIAGSEHAQVTLLRDSGHRKLAMLGPIRKPYEEAETEDGPESDSSKE